MADKIQLKNRNGKEVYPLTTTDCVIDNGKYLSDTLNDIPVVEEYVGEVEDIIGVTREDLKKDLFIDMWNERCSNMGNVGKYNSETNYFELNGLTDITFEEAITIYSLCPNEVRSDYNDVYHCESGGNYFKTIPLCRTFFIPYRYSSSGGWTYAERMFYGQSKMEVITFPTYISFYSTTGAKGMFCGCSSLRVINCKQIQLTNSSPEGRVDMFKGCTSLESLNIFGIKNDINFADSPNLSIESLSYLVNNRNNYTPISVVTVTVHPDVYAKLTDPNNAEWSALNDLAISKQILFASN